MTRRTSTWADGSCLIVIVLLAGVGILVLVGPVVVVLTTSLTTSASLKCPPPQLSTQWYVALFDPVRSRHIHNAAYNSLWVASLATATATLLAVPAALAIARLRTATARTLEAAFLAPLVLPTLAYGLATLMFFSLLGYRPSLWLL